MFQSIVKRRWVLVSAEVGTPTTIRGQTWQHRFMDLSLNEQTRTARRGWNELDLSPTEYRLLELFMRHPKQILLKDQIYNIIWGADLSSTSNTLAVYIGYLRRKLEANGEPRLIHTVRGMGYTLRENTA